jgi:hypothetical protein
LAPKGCFIAAEAIERVVGQIGETQKATRELSGRMDGGSTDFDIEQGTASVSFVMPCDAGSWSKLPELARPSSARETE